MIGLPGGESPGGEAAGGSEAGAVLVAQRFSAVLPQTYTVPVAPLPPALVRSLHARAGAARWQVPEAAFAEALTRSLRHRYPGAAGAAPSRAPDEPDPSTVEHYLSDLHLADLALAQACAAGHDGAWRHFLDELRPALRRAAHAIAGEEGGDLADALYGVLSKMAKRLVKGSPVGIVLEPDDGHGAIVAKQAEPSVTVRGPVGELVMFVYGRQAHSRVEVLGDADSVAAVNAASFGI